MAKRRRKRKSSRPRSTRLGFWLALLVAAVAAAAVYVLWLDREVRSAFEGKRWALPATVYARPLELYAGRSLRHDDLVRELEALGYRRSDGVDQAGEYAVSDSRLSVHTRRFRYWDGTEPARHIQVRFDNRGITAIMAVTTGEAVPVLRLGPRIIGKIYPEHHEDRILIRYDNAPQQLINALIAVEDRDFYQHYGVDPLAIARAAWVNLLAGRIRQGGSTLTQQLVKNFYLTRDRTLWRKINEAIMALLLESHYSKQEILEAYLNEVYLGQQGNNAIHGFGLAAEFYFRRPLTELSTEQLALLVGLVRGASYYNPRRHPQRALERRNLVLRLMADQGYLEPDAAEQLISRPLGISDVPGWTSDRYPTFVDLVRRQLHRDYDSDDLQNAGLRIFTTLDPVAQHTVQKSLDQRLQRLEQQYSNTEELQGAVILASVDTGEIIALTGQRGGSFGFNRALDARRPIGSLVKPAVYLTALARPEQYSVITPIADMPVSLPQPDGDSWMPENYDREFHGEVPLYQALAQSYNLATVNLGLELGVARVADTLEAMLPGLSLRHYPSLLLGSVDLTPLQVTQMYQTIAAGGFRTPLKSIVAVLDSDGEPLRRYPLSVDQVAPTRASYLMTFLLTQVVERGTARSAAARLPDLMPLAGKTGTTDELRDSWFAGFGSDRIGVVWIGRDDNQPTELTGASGALQVWTDIMAVIKPRPLTLTPPDGVRWQKVINGKRTDEDCERASSFPFIVPHLPEEYEPCHGSNAVERLFQRIF
ncbi:MAG: penicillin-binding protein 1B [Gammaproteobacteria bacterium]|nr:penicillin-binding protein 1B [Gammaproteobacteria bacterium]